ncbi:glycosyltransferase family 4 protein [Amycolatopsis sp. NBC_00438]|uniref:glycosyltransferase family 4 protein n=1 Tax=Amycolatopsis sp. NBC_00438 TaxID=2903558 RepID=UPI002E1F1010
MTISATTTTTHPTDAVARLRALGPGASPDRIDDVRRALHPSFAGPALIEYAGLRPARHDPDSAVAALRALAREPVAPAPAEVLAATPETGDELIDSLVTAVAMDIFGDAVAAHGSAAAAAAIGAAAAGASPRRRILLLDLAERHALRCFPVPEVIAGIDGDRGYRHAALRYLSQCDADPEAAEAIASVHETTDDPYDRVLASICLARPGGVPDGSPLWTVPPPDRPGLTVAQSMLLGSFDHPGAGASGGLTVLLRHLGHALPRRAGIARVVTLTLLARDRLAERPALAEPDGAGHVVLRLPVDAPGAPAQIDLSRHRPAITFLARRLLWLSGCTPDVVHVRYSDDGSAAIAQAARALGARTVFTLTADPHRSLAERHAAARPADPAAARFDLHRMYTADRLVATADTLLGLPGRPGGELSGYFPRLRGREPESVAEGIPLLPRVPTADARQQRLAGSLFGPPAGLPRLGDAARGLPIVLSVGRLHPVKQQDLLVEAWLTRGLHRQTALVLVGGDPAAPTAEETHVLDRILALCEKHPEATGRLAVLPALGNDDVRLLEHGLARWLPVPTPHLYVCPSRKEEFGIAVLEAMDAGLLVLGPRRGGLGHYIEHGRNGMLADTATPGRFADALTAFVRAAADDPVRARAAAAAGRATVARRFGIDLVAGRFADVYQRSVAEPPRVVPGPASPDRPAGR